MHSCSLVSVSGVDLGFETVGVRACKHVTHSWSMLLAIGHAMKVAIMSHYYMQDQSKSAVKKHYRDTNWVSFSHS